MPVKRAAAGVRTLLAFALLAGCQPEGRPGALSGVGADYGDATNAAYASAGPVDPDMIRAPELYRASGTAKWNGLRTARGVWVAHPRAGSPRRVRIVNSVTGKEIDGMLYRSRRADAGDIVTLSSDAARGLEVAKGEETQIALFGLRPKGSQSPSEQASVEARAQGELATRIVGMEDTDLLRLVAAAMRGMGYATVFEDGPLSDQRPVIRAFPLPGSSSRLPPIRIVVRPRAAVPASADDVLAIQQWLTGSGDLGVLVSIAGFDEGAWGRLDPEGARIEMVDLDSLLNIWLTHYEQMSPPDRELLPLRPVYFAAGQ